MDFLWEQFLNTNKIAYSANDPYPPPTQGAWVKINYPNFVGGPKGPQRALQVAKGHQPST